MDTSAGSDYMAGSSGCSGSRGRNNSLEAESEFTDDLQAGNAMKVRSTGVVS